ncbi:MAG: alpha/beta fold hydrolase [Candidatus Bathyarchaeota archaeon]|nr:MAG: alpha/beta fold hydrolase [Candidatus Bathyarchaeota archaeon]
MPKVKVNDIRIYHELHGDGHPLLMIMGLSANLNWWDTRLIEALSSKFTLVMYDNRGAGRTNTSDKEHTIRLYADDAVGLMNALRIDKAHVLGFSMGGMIAQELTLNYPHKVGKLVLCSTHCGGANSVQPSQEILEMLTADIAGLSAMEVAKMTLHLLLTTNFIEENPDIVDLIIERLIQHPISRASYMCQLNAVMRFDTFERLPKIKNPTLILQGQEDVLVPSTNGSILAKAIPDAKLIIYENSAHMLVEDMKKVIHNLTWFLS